MPNYFWETSLVQVAYKKCYHNRISQLLMTWNSNIFQMRWGSPAFTLSAAYLNESLKNWTRSTFYMRANFVDLLRASVF